ncbi:MAG: SDR family oxidoreductase [Candidatus Handelsmanbacteria bacterium]|nr:SDR family oxidoreductase [Candidatus Handelsmanbacteria bacterium]
MRLKNKVAIITGGGSGIGRATCQRFVEEGARVVVADVNQKGGKETVALLPKGKAIFVKADVSQEDQVKRLIKKAAQTFGKLDILVNNAAAFVFGRVEDTTLEDWNRVLGTNVLGPAWCVKHAVPEMKKAGGGAIVTIGSISSFIAQPDYVPYNTSKSALINMTRCLAMDLAQFNIRANVVCPGVIRTPTLIRLIDEWKMTPEDIQREWGNYHLLKRLGEPREIANAVLFLASDEASFVTGTHLMVDGGYTAH